jgi:hypothetical protein
MQSFRLALVVCSLILLCATAQTAKSDDEVQSDKTALPAGTAEDKHIAGVIPNYKTMPDLTLVAPMTAKQKFALATRDAFDPMAFVVSGMYAGVGLAVNQNEQWGHGISGYGKRYAAAVADQIQSSYFQDALVPVMFHQDPRYFRMAYGPAKKRLWYAVSRTFVTRSDAGTTQINASEFVGNAMQYALSTAYYPAESRNAEDVSTKYFIQFGTDALFNVAKEFWPDIRRKFFHGR